MKNVRRSVGFVAAAGLASVFAMVPMIASQGGASPATTSVVLGTHSTAATASNDVGSVPAGTAINFNVTLNPRNAAGVAAEAKAVSDPASSSYKHYLTIAQWERQFSPTSADVGQVTSWLKGAGLTVGAVSADRLSISVSGTAAQVEHAFGTKLDYYKVNGQKVWMITSNVSVPTSVAGYVQGFPGLSQIVNTSDATTGVAATAASDASSGNAVVSSKNPPIPPPAGFRNAEPCSTYYGQKVDTTAPAYGDGYPATLPYSPCGYTPQQMENAYGISTDIANGDSGKGETVAIVDAYESATLQADTQEYYRTVDPAIPLQSSQFSTLISPKFDDETLCGANGWNAEQSLDIEAVHAMAPSANIIYVGAEDCINGLLNAEREIVDGNLANIITNSWGDDVGDLLDPTTDQQSYNTLFEEAVATGIGIQFSAGDDGDNFALSGLTAPDFPASSPFVTTVGGTSLEIGQNGARAAEYGWSTSKSYLCTHSLVNIICTKAELGTYVPPAPGAYDYGGGGGTSFQYLQPYYQAGIVPAALAERNTVYGTTNLRVEPDISVDADPTTGFLIGLTQLFGTKAEFGTYRIGGTSLASPLLAGMLADADQAGNSDLGFVNPLIYKLSQTTPGAFYDVKSGGLLAIARSDYVDGIDNADGTYTSIRTVTYEGLEEYCDGTGSCEERDVALTTTPGFDSMTGLGTPSTSFVTDLANS